MLELKNLMNIRNNANKKVSILNGIVLERFDNILNEKKS